MVTMFKMSISISVHKGSINELLLCPAAGGGANLGNAAVGLIRGEEKNDLYGLYSSSGLEDLL